MSKIILMQLEDPNDLLKMLVNLNDRDPLQYKSHMEDLSEPVRFKSLELLECLTEIKMGLEVIKESAKGRVDRKITGQFNRIDKAISCMTDKVLEPSSIK
jgi:hypothetical protein